MDRFTISLDAPLAKAFDRLIRAKGYRNRSEAVRDLLRGQLEAHRVQADEAPYCVANLSYVYRHDERELAERVTAMQHRRHDLTVSTMHVHLDHDHCLEIIVLRGPRAEVQSVSDRLISTKGVLQGKLTLAAMEPQAHEHTHPHPHKH